MFKLFAVVAAALGISFLCSVLEAVLLSATPTYAGLLKKQGKPGGAALARLKKRVDEPIAAILTLNTISHTVGAAWAGSIAAGIVDSWAVGVFSGIAVFSGLLTIAVLIFSEIVPKTLGAAYWKALAGPSARLLEAMVLVLKPILFVLGRLSHWVNRGKGSGQATMSRAEIRVMTEIGRREGTIDEDEYQVMSGVLGIGLTRVDEVMTPRTDIVAVPAEADYEQAMATMLETGKLRLPVFQGSLDEIVGVLLARDLWRAQREGQGGMVSGVMKPMPFVPGAKPVEALISEMRARRTQMAIVLDEFGGTAGLVTLEDLIEEIVGEIQDEHDRDEPRDFRELDEGRLLVYGGTALADARERLGLKLDGDYDTVGGYVFGGLKRLARAGDFVALPDGRHQFRVARMRGRRIEYVVFEEKGPPSKA